MISIDLNCDMGESFGAYQIGNDESMMKYITSANIACGFHAGDPAVMDQTVKQAIRHGVAIGAHPGLPDLAGFGRRKMDVSPEEVYQMVLYQIGALKAFVEVNGGRLNHVKPHGALYNMASVNRELADAISEAVAELDSSLILFGLSNSELVKAGEQKGLRVAHEVFADRTYQEDGTLTSRKELHALITSDEEAIQQALQMVKEHKVKTVSGVMIDIQADTICLHGDGAHALSFAKKIHQVFTEQGIELKAL
ncbi:MAG: 5-oxoprolinase subunit PxpA [Bacillaceae bacterium]|nr:5-oxoprolinase subunit PxpA [Bacillaceae bacterium]